MNDATPWLDHADRYAARFDDARAALVALTPADGVVFGAEVIHVDDLLVYRDGGTRRVLAPAEKAILCPRGANVTVSAGDNELQFTVHIPGFTGTLAGQAGAEPAPVLMFVDLPASERLLLDRLQTRAWKPAGDVAHPGMAPAVAAAEIKRIDTDASLRVPPASPVVVSDLWPIAPCPFDRRLIRLPVALFAQGPADKDGFVLTVTYPEGAAAAAQKLAGKLRLNVAPYRDGFAARLHPHDITWEGSSVVILPSAELRCPQRVRVLRADDPDSGTIYFDARDLLDPSRPAYAFEDGTGQSDWIARLHFREPVNVSLWLAYAPAVGWPTELKPGSTLESLNRSAIEQAELLAPPAPSPSQPPVDRLFGLLLSGGRCVTPCDVRGFVARFDLLRLNEQVDAAAVRFEHATGRWHGSLLPYTEVVVPLREEHQLSKTDRAAATEALEHAINAWSGQGVRLRVRLLEFMGDIQ